MTVSRLARKGSFRDQTNVLKRVHLVLRVLHSDRADRELAFALRQRGRVENLAYSVVTSRLSQSQSVQPRSEKHTTGRRRLLRNLMASAVIHDYY